MFSKTSVNLFFNTENNPGKTIKYITGIDCDFCILIQHQRKKPTLYISSLEEVPKTNSVEVKTLTSLKSIFSTIKQKKPRAVGLHFGEISKSLFDGVKKELKGIKLVDVSKDIAKKRLTKEPREVKNIQQAINITEKILSNLIKKLKTFTYEIQAIQYIKQEMIKHNVEQSFEPIVATGKNAANPHYFPKETSKMNKGFCIIDMGVKYNGYCADISRTVYIGTPSKKDVALYSEVFNEMKKIEMSVKSGSKQFSTSFKMIHALGHGIGLDVHESPYVGVQELKPNMTIAIEPGKYTKTKGVRIEDNFLVTKKGLKRLSTSSQQLIIVRKN